MASASESQHMEHLRCVFDLLVSNDLVAINKSKWLFGVGELEYLGHLLTSEKIRPLTSCIDAIHQYPTPQTRSDLQWFLGMINYNHQFPPGIAPKLAPLHATSSGRGKDITWTPQCQQAFEDAKTVLSH